MSQIGRSLGNGGLEFDSANYLHVVLLTIPTDESRIGKDSLDSFSDGTQEDLDTSYA